MSDSQCQFISLFSIIPSPLIGPLGLERPAKSARSYEWLVFTSPTGKKVIVV